MLLRLRTKLSELERALRTSFGTDISTPSGRLAAHVNFQLMDHAFLRILWRNFDKVAPGVYRSNQPSPRRLRVQARKLGLKGILNLRGEGRAAHYLLEKEVADELGIPMVAHAIPARFAPTREMLLGVIDKMRAMPKPFLLHCKSGADRAGFAATLYLHVIEGRPLAEARKQLSFRYFHLSSTATGIIDHFFDVYEARQAKGEIPLERWIAEEYDPWDLLESWKSRGGTTGHDR